MGCKQVKVSGDRSEPTDNCNTCFPAELFTNKECIVERYQCPIMWGVLNDPVRAKCGHAYCSQCINNSIDVDSRRRCPVCRQSIGCLVKDKALEKAISKLPVKCFHAECSWSGSLKGLQKHLKKTCKIKGLKCVHCTKVFLSMDDLTQHQTDHCDCKSSDQSQSKDSSEHLNVRLTYLLI